MLVKDLLENASWSVDFVIVNNRTHELPFGVKGSRCDFEATCCDARTIESRYAHLMQWEVVRWFMTSDAVWVYAIAPEQDMADVVSEFMDYLDSLGMGALY